MAFVFGDRVKETSISGGLDPMALGGATLGFQSFAVGVGVANDCFYGIVDTVTNEWEMGIGAVGPGTLTRTTVISSSNSNLPVVFSFNQKVVYTTIPKTFYAGALDGPAHEGIDHTNAPWNLLDVPDHEAVDHTLAPLSLLSIANLPTEHTSIDHLAAPFNLLDEPTHESIDHKLAPYNLLDAPAHEAVNHLAAPFNLITQALHDAGDHSLIPTHPTPGGMGSRTLVMTTDITLLNTGVGGETIQFLDTNGADRIVNLPAGAVANPAFFLVNTGLFLITIADPAGNTVSIMEPDDAVRVVSGGLGSAWAVVSLEKWSRPILSQSYTWGGAPSANNFFITNQNPNSLQQTNAADNIGAYHVVHTSGVIDGLTWKKANDDGLRSFQLYVNGVAQQNLHIVNPKPNDRNVICRARYNTPIVVNQGDRIAVSAEGQGVNNSLIQAMVRNPNGGYLIQYGGDALATGAFLELARSRDTNVSRLIEDEYTSAHLIGSGNLVSIAYAIGMAGVASEIDVLINGVVDQVVTLSSGATVGGSWVGVETLTGSFVNGDRIAIRTGTSPMNDSVISVLTDVVGQGIQYKGDPVNDDCYQVWAGDANAGGVKYENESAKGVVTTRGRVWVSWNTENLPTGPMAIVKNGCETALYNWTGASSGAVAIAMSVKPGDTISVGTETGSEGDTNILVVIR